jgi:hypothetical protein
MLPFLDYLKAKETPSYFFDKIISFIEKRRGTLYGIYIQRKAPTKGEKNCKTPQNERN